MGEEEEPMATDPPKCLFPCGGSEIFKIGGAGKDMKDPEKSQLPCPYLLLLRIHSSCPTATCWPGKALPIHIMALGLCGFLPQNGWKLAMKCSEETVLDQRSAAINSHVPGLLCVSGLQIPHV